MANYIPKDNIEEIAEGIILDYLKDKADEVTCIDIEGLLVDYFKLDIRYEKIAEDDFNIDGFISNGVASLKIWENGKKVNRVFPKGTVIFDNHLLEIQYSSHKRFSFAHEGSHYASHQIYGTVLGVAHTSFDNERNYTIQEMRSHFNISEAQTNAMAAVFLMPRFLLEKTLNQYTGGRPIDMYGDTVFLQKDKQVIKEMSNQLGVSPSALRIRLSQCGFINHRPINELIEQIKEQGGWGYDCQ